MSRGNAGYRYVVYEALPLFSIYFFIWAPFRACLITSASMVVLLLTSVFTCLRLLLPDSRATRVRAGPVPPPPLAKS